ncbi:MAG: DUF2807 domain-containing protein [Bacteroidales bacterium]|nr:DUF2807 domain-containing protein [Bacteroidales bacterium]
MKIYLLFCFVVFLFAIQLNSCKRENSVGCFVSNGSIITINRTLENFSEIELNHVFTVYLVQDTAYYLEITSGENILPGIKSEVVNRRLIIDNNNTCNWMRGYSKIPKIKIHAPIIKYIQIIGECDLFSEGKINSDTIFIDVESGASLCDLEVKSDVVKLKIHAGTGKFTIKGECNFSYFFNHGNAHIFGENLKAKRVQIHNNSTGDARLYSTEFLHIEYIGRGDIYYKGNPPEILVQESLGEGQLIQIDN